MNFQREKKLKEFCAAFPLSGPNGSVSTGIGAMKVSENNYRVLFHIKDTAYTLSVLTTNDFPVAKPTINFQNPFVISHPWLDQFKNVLGCPKLNSWTRDSSLIDVVKELHASMHQHVTTNQNQGSRFTTAGVAVAPGGGPTNFNAPPTQPYYSGGGAYGGGGGGAPMQLYQNAGQQTQSQISGGRNPPFNYVDNHAYANANANPAASNHIPYALQVHQQQQPPPLLQQQQLQQQQQQQQLQQQQQQKLHQQQQQQLLLLQQQQQQQQHRKSVSSNSSDSSEHFLKDLLDNVTDNMFHKVLENLPDEELQLLLDDSSFYKAFLNTEIDVIKLANENYGESVKVNTGLCRDIISTHENVAKLQSDIKLHQASLESKVSHYDKCLDEFQKKIVQSREAVMQQLQSQRNKFDLDSKKIELEFNEGHKDPDAFVKEYLDTRTKYYALDKKLKLATKR